MIDLSKIKDSLTIKAGRWEAEICPRLGANVIGLRYDGRDVLRPLSGEEQIAKNPYIQGAPILLPANRTYLGKFSFEGRDYELPITEPRTNSHLHGLVHKEPFELVSADERCVVMKLKNEGKVYPFAFEMLVTYTIDEEGFSQSYEITNVDTKNMPYTFCLHSTFTQPKSFIMPVECRQEHNSIDIPTGRFVPLTEQEEKYNTGSPSKGLSVSGYYRSAGNTAEIDDILYTVSDNFDCWITYNARGMEDFICIEPQAGMVNGLNYAAPEGHRVLEPGKTIDFSATVSYNKR